MLEREDVVNAREGSELDYIVLFIAHLIIQQRPYLMSNLLIPFSGSSDESSREIIASCKPRNKICGARGNNKGPPPAHRGWPEMNISYSHGKGLTRVDSSAVPS
jgi:hypothetical protein